MTPTSAVGNTVRRTSGESHWDCFIPLQMDLAGRWLPILFWHRLSRHWLSTLAGKATRVRRVELLPHCLPLALSRFNTAGSSVWCLLPFLGASMLTDEQNASLLWHVAVNTRTDICACFVEEMMPRRVKWVPKKVVAVASFMVSHLVLLIRGFLVCFVGFVWESLKLFSWYLFAKVRLEVLHVFVFFV